MVVAPRRASAAPSDSASCQPGSASRSVLLPNTATVGRRCLGRGIWDIPGGQGSGPARDGLPPGTDPHHDTEAAPASAEPDPCERSTMNESGLVRGGQTDLESQDHLFPRTGFPCGHTTGQDFDDAATSHVLE